MIQLQRRQFLAAIGASGWLAAAGGSARASAPQRPLRFVAIYTPHGRAHELWQPRPGFDIGFPGSALAPFDDASLTGKSLKQRLLVLDGIDLSAGIAVGTSGHDGSRVILTGSGADGKTPSIDQFLAVEQGLGAETVQSTLVCAIGNDQADIKANLSYARGGTPIPKQIDPEALFAELFGGPLSGKSPAALAAERAKKRSVLDLVRADLARLGRRAPRSERNKLEQHAGALRELERRIAGFEQRCEAGPAPNPAAFPKLLAYGGGEPYFEAITSTMIDLVARALACDVTRFATLFLGDLTRTRLDPRLPDDVHGDVAHRYDARTERHPGTPSSWERLALQNRHSYTQVARLAQRLDEAGVLDDTLVYVSSDMGDPARHSSRNVPTLILGGGGRFETGRYLDLRRADGEGVPNNRILVSICQAFGVPVERFGHSADAGIVSGKLDALHG